MDFQLDSADLTARPGQAIETYRELMPALHSVRSALDQKKIDALLRLLGNSNFLARWARRYPEKAAEVLAADLSFPMGDAELRSEFSGVLGAYAPLDFEKLSGALLDQKYRHLFRISLRDVGMGSPFQEIVSEFSSLARAILQFALDWQQRDLLREYGEPCSKDNGLPIPFTVLAMGKLGGSTLFIFILGPPHPLPHSSTDCDGSSGHHQYRPRTHGSLQGFRGLKRDSSSAD